VVLYYNRNYLSGGAFIAERFLLNDPNNLIWIMPAEGAYEENI